MLPPFGPGCALILGVQEGGGGGAVLLLILGVHGGGGGVLLPGAALGHGGVCAYLAVVVLGPVPGDGTELSAKTSAAEHG